VTTGPSATTPSVAGRLGFAAIDADNHYYEATDAFIRHIEPKMAKRAMQWATIDGRERLLVGGKVNKFIPNPTFNPVSRPGALIDYFRGKNLSGSDIKTLFGQLEPLPAAYLHPEARLEMMDQQGLEASYMFPTLGVGMETSMEGDPEAMVAAFRAFNRWLLDDWGFATEGRLFASPMITLVDVDSAVAELQWALDNDARSVCLRAAPVRTPSTSHSPADPRYDKFWDLANRSGIVVAFHSGDAGYGRYIDEWEPFGNFEAFRASPMRALHSAYPIPDLFASCLSMQLFRRFPNLRMAAIEFGADWVPALFKRLKKAYGQMPGAFPEDPRETFRRHISVAPFYEDDIRNVVNLIGVERVLFGSDFPHAEGLADPVSFVDDLPGFSDDEIHTIMRSNMVGLLQRQPLVTAASGVSS
jgi:predicted TIM-barrel fold metal-dependent hydrolase